MEYKKPQATIIQGNVGIYPLTTADQVILADGTRLEKDGKINVDVANSADSAKLGGKAPEYYLQPRNLLDNSGFQKSGESAGATSYDGAHGYYCIDRWVAWAETSDDTPNVVVQNGYVTVETGGKLQQKLASYKQNTIYTAAAKRTDGTILIVSGIFSSEEAGYDIFLKIGSDGLANVGLRSGDYLWAALYEGAYTADTLPPYVPKGYAAELAECDLYYRPLGDNVMSVIGMTSSDGRIVLLKSIRPMREGGVPTVINNGTLYARVNGTDYTTTNVRINKSDKSGVEIFADAEGVPSKQTATIHGSALFALSRDL